MNPRKIIAAIESDQGQGNLDAKAYFAAVVGPLRIIFGKNGSAIVVEGRPTQLVKSSGAIAQWAYVTVILPGNAPADKVALFTNGPSTGFNSALPVTLKTTTGRGNCFEAVLAPGDMVYAQSAPGEGTFPVVVSTVWF